MLRSFSSAILSVSGERSIHSSIDGSGANAANTAASGGTMRMRWPTVVTIPCGNAGPTRSRITSSSARCAHHQTFELELLGERGQLVTRRVDDTVALLRGATDRDEQRAELVRLVHGMADEVAGVGHRREHGVRRGEVDVEPLRQLREREGLTGVRGQEVQDLDGA